MKSIGQVADPTGDLNPTQTGADGRFQAILL